MTTPAITASVPAPGAETPKVAPRESASNTAFNDILNREIADRNPPENARTQTSKESTETAKTDSTTNASSSKPADEVQAKESTDADRTDTDVSAEQMLMMAAQLIGVNAASPVLPGATDAALSGISKVASIVASLQNGVPQFSELSTPSLPDKNAFLGAQNADGSDLTAPGNLMPNAGPSDAGLSLPADLSASAQNGVDNAAAIALVPSAKDLRAEIIEGAGPDVSANLAPLQQTAAAIAETTSAAASEKISPHVGTSAWNQAIGQKIVWMIGNEQQSASLTLNPPDLGPMRVVLSVSSTQASASFYSPHAEVREALEAALPRLRDILGDAGIQLGQANVSADTHQQQSSSAPTFSTTNGTASVSDTLTTTQQPLPQVSQIVREGFVDTFA